jgi:predicted Rossmann fold flavoprotein
VILTLSSHVNKYDAKLLTVAIDLKPALDAVMLDKRLLRDFSENINRKLSNSLGDLLPKALIPEVIWQSGLSGEETVNQITKEQRASIVATLKSLKFPLKGFDDINNAIITSGGVNVKEINPKTMESKIVNGLFFAGEVIDVDALTGGYNLQIALSTGYAAAKSAAEKELQEVKND